MKLSEIKIAAKAVSTLADISGVNTEDVLAEITTSLFNEFEIDEIRKFLESKLELE